MTDNFNCAMEDVAGKFTYLLIGDDDGILPSIKDVSCLQRK